MAAPVLTLTPFAYNGSTAYDLSALTGGVATSASLQGYTGADFAWFQNGGQSVKQSGGHQCVPYQFADSGTVSRGNPYSNTHGNPINIGAGDISDSSAAVTSPTNWQAFNCTGPNQGVKFTPIANRQLKHMLVALSVDSGAYTINASLSDGSAAPQSIVCTPAPAYQEAQSWFTVDWRALIDTAQLNLEIRKTSAGASNFWIQFAYITVPVDPPIPRGMSRVLTYSGLFGGKNT